jgi:hypothetical protein
MGCDPAPYDVEDPAPGSGVAANGKWLRRSRPSIGVEREKVNFSAYPHIGRLGVKIGVLVLLV